MATASTTDTRTAQNTSGTVSPSASSMIVCTDWSERWLVPQSPVTKPFISSTYWTTSGRSSPSWSRTRDAVGIAGSAAADAGGIGPELAHEEEDRIDAEQEHRDRSQRAASEVLPHGRAGLSQSTTRG